MFVKLIVVLCAVWTPDLCQSIGFTWTSNPTDVSVCAEKNATFPWHYTVDNDGPKVLAMYWSKDGKNIAYETEMGFKQTPGYENRLTRTSVTNGSADIKLEDVTETDKGVYSVTLTVNPVKSHWDLTEGATLTIMSPVRNVTLSADGSEPDSLTVVEDQQKNFTLSVYGAKPSPTVQCYREDSERNTVVRLPETTDPPQTSGRNTTVILHLILDGQYSEQTIYCQAENICNTQGVKSNKIQIIVKKGNTGGNTGAIVGGVLGGVALLVLALGALYCWRRRRCENAPQGNSGSMKETESCQENEPGETAVMV